MPDFTNTPGWQIQQLANLESSAGFQAWTVNNPAPPAIPATTVAAANPYGKDSIVVIAGGTVTVVAVSTNGINGTFVTDATATPTAVLVPAAGAIKLTYSVAPTAWYWLTSALNVAEVDL